MSNLKKMFLYKRSKQTSDGSWLSAREALENLPLSGIFDAESKTKFDTDINNYISENY